VTAAAGAGLCVSLGEILSSLNVYYTIQPPYRMDRKYIYKCEPCVFHTTCKRDYDRHILTEKHLGGGSVANKIIKSPEGYLCPSCNNTFKSRTSIYKHISRCKTYSSNGASGIHTANPADDIMCADDKITITKEMFMSLLQNNQEMMKMIKALSEQSNVNNPTNNTTNNMTNNTINSNNNTFNMNLFLNEKCKDAMNMKDFVNSIQLNLTDLENVERDGYVKGMSNILINNLQKTDLYKRPVHCSDVKRETLYVKDDNKWEREGPDHQKMVNAVLAVEQKNVALVGEWAKANPRCMNSSSKENERYMKLSKVTTDGEKEGNIAKVIRNVSKNVAVEKDTNMIE
jgi:hypothetical protein